ncbi:MAG: ABC transporter substrate-binding protein [Armatimonadetes bacterium]|nr:ABC transporter substrate-binding protein [Armatimonadota bacterium]MBS1702149.1 ABC transporter substrate-binding protein [Armatimonadota bacterium]
MKIGGRNLNLLALGILFAGALVGCNGGGGTDSNSSGASGGNTASNDSGAGARKMPTAEGFKVEGDTIDIGVAASISGDSKPWGDDELAGCQLAADEANAAGGINGKKIKLVVEDTASKPDQAKLAAEKLLGQKVVGIVGEVSSGNTIQIAKSAFDKGVPVVAVGATRTDLTNEGAHVFRVCYTDAFQGPVMATFAFDKLKLKKVAIITDNFLPYSQGLSASFKDKFLALGGEVVDEETYESGGKQVPDFQAVLTNIAKANPDGIFMSGYFPEVGPLAKQARAAGIKATFMGGDGWDSDTILTGGGDAIIGGYFCNHYNNLDQAPEVQDFLKKWRAKHGGSDPSTTMGALGYDAMALTIDALKRAKSLDSRSLIDALENTENFKGVSGTITLKGMNGNPPKKAIVVQVTAKNGSNWQKYAVSYTPDQIK